MPVFVSGFPILYRKVKYQGPQSTKWEQYDSESGQVLPHDIAKKITLLQHFSTNLGSQQGQAQQVPYFFYY